MLRVCLGYGWHMIRNFASGTFKVRVRLGLVGGVVGL